MSKEEIPPTHNERIINTFLNKITSENYKKVSIEKLLFKDIDCLSENEKQFLKKLLNLKIKLFENTEKLTEICNLNEKISTINEINRLNEEFENIGKEQLYNYEKSDGSIMRTKIFRLK